ncbi:hypothetical protein [Pseudomonas sp. TWP3-1]|uniref:hypothetical protein n=1 Tax=Pseudomonas sp. TWP3-1 TaxID=2804631 RepID=UPI003CFA7645
MAKPPKQIPAAHSSPPRPATETARVSGDDIHILRPGLHSQAGDLPFAGPSSQRPPETDGGTRQPAVEVSEMLTRHQPGESSTAPDALNLSARPTTPTFLPAHLAIRLTPATDSPEGIRYDGRDRIYVDMREGTAMVSKNPDGHYQLTSANELVPSGYRVERIRETHLWQKLQPGATRRPAADAADSMAGPSKRARVEDDQSAQAKTLSGVLDLSSRQWRNWGQSTRPTSGQSVEIDGLHYPIVSQIVRSNTPVVCIKHPHFNPERFDAFEQMLVDEPALQPRWATRSADDRWAVADTRLPFERSLTRSVAESFEYLSGQSSRAVANTLFYQSRGAEVINGEGLQVLGQTLRHWENRAIPAPRRSLADPLMLLPIQPTLNDGTFGGKIELPSASAANLQRIDFDSAKFPDQWREYSATPRNASLQKLFKSVLEKSGYTVSPPNHSLLENALVFYRPGLNVLFAMKLPTISAAFIRRYTKPGSELNNSAALMQLDDAGRQRLSALLAQDNVIYLVGGIDPLNSQTPSLFVLREG